MFAFLLKHLPVTAIIDCGELTTPANGAVVQSKGTKFNSVATFFCAEGFHVVGCGTRMCGMEGWTNESPVCSECHIKGRGGGSKFSLVGQKSCGSCS